jgi:PAS domain S-box-containing protein
MEKILAIDDNADNLIVLRALLMESFPKAQFIPCQSGKRGIELAIAQNPDVILLDLVMPEMDGYEVCQTLKANTATKIIPIIIVTAARTNKENRIKALESGADAFLTKPLDESELMVQVRAMLRIKASEDHKLHEKEQLTQLVAERTRELETSQVAMLNLLEDLKAENESRKKIETALRESETHYRTLANSGQALIWTSGIDKKCDYFNQPWLDFTGRALDQELGDGWTEGVHPDDLQQCLHIYDTAFNRQEKFSMEYRIRHADGNYRWIQENGSPRYNSDGEFIGYIGHCLDITEHKLSEQKIVENEKLLTNIIENIPITLIIKEIETLSYTMINKAGEALFQEDRKNILGKNVFDLFHLPDADYLNTNDVSVIQSGVASDSGEKEVCFINGLHRVIHTIRVPIIDDSNQIRSLLVLSEDITEKKKMQDALKESEELYRTLLNASPEGIVILNMQERIMELSDMMLDIFKIPTKNDFIGVEVFQFVPEREWDKLRALLKATLLEKGVQQVEFSMLRSDGAIFPCEISTTLIQEVNGTPKAYMAILRDISERKEIERQLIRTERMVSLGEMASAMAHEINQPLLSISLGIDNLLMKVQQANLLDEAYFTKKSAKIFDDVARISRLIDHVRTFSRDHDREKPIPIDINESIRSAVSMISEQFSHHGIELTITCDQDIPLVMGNTYQFEQVILNLLTNAKDALEEKREKTQSTFDMAIDIKTYHDDRSNYVEVHDNGIGILPDDIDKIMLPFFTTKEVGKGTGLGLSISFGIVKEMGGTIQVNSEPLVDTTFRIDLPVVPIQQEIQWMKHERML